MRELAKTVSHNQPGNPQRLAEVVVEFVDAPNPPVRLPLGSDTVAAISAKHAENEALIEAWRAVAVSTDFPAGT